MASVPVTTVISYLIRPVSILEPQHPRGKQGIPGDLWRARGARAYTGVWGGAPSGVQGQSPW